MSSGAERVALGGLPAGLNPRPAVAADALLGPAQENLDHVLARVDAHPQTTFTFYLPPYSILFWDMTIREGELEATLTMHERVLEGLISRPNVRVFYFMDDQALITDLDQYSDHIHYSLMYARSWPAGFWRRSR